MKKFLALLLSCLMLVSIMTACGEKAPAGGDQGGEKVLNMRLGSKQGRRAPCCPFMAASVAVLLRGPFHGDRVQYKFGVLEPNN